MTVSEAGAPPEFTRVLDSWTPVAEEVTGRLDPWPGTALAALLSAPPLHEGDELPPLWSEAYLRPTRSPHELAPDGHPARDGLVPPLEDRRRMFGGGRITVAEPLRVGEVATRRSTVEDLRVRRGRSGWLLLVTEAHDLSVDGRLRVREERDIVYRRAADVVASSRAGRPRDQAQENEAQGNEAQRTPAEAGEARGDAGPRAEAAFELHPDERLLFCFSALTYNAHRIHYDRRFTVEVEGHRDLLVHGPLLVIGALEAARRLQERSIAEVSYRLTAPAYPGSPVRFAVAPAGPQTTTVTGSQQGTRVVRTSVTWREAAGITSYP